MAFLHIQWTLKGKYSVFLNIRILIITAGYFGLVSFIKMSQILKEWSADHNLIIATYLIPCFLKLKRFSNQTWVWIWFFNLLFFIEHKRSLLDYSHIISTNLSYFIPLKQGHFSQSCRVIHILINKKYQFPTSLGSSQVIDRNQVKANYIHAPKKIELCDWSH